MEEKRKNIPWLGIIFIVLGVLFIMDIDDLFILWPCIIIGIGINKYLQYKEDIFLPSFLVFFGAYFLLNNYNMLPYFIEDNFWAIPLIIIGLYIVFQNRESPWRKKNLEKESLLNVSDIFGGVKQEFKTEDFRGGNISAIFGGPTIDLTQSKIQESKAVLNVTVFFGGVDLFLPSDWEVRVHTLSIFGGVDVPKRVNLEGGEQKILIVKGLVLFGGVDIR